MHQRPDHVAVVDGVLGTTGQPRHLLNAGLTVKDHQVIFIDLHPQGLLQQAGRYRIEIAQHVDGAVLADPHGDFLEFGEAVDRQRFHHRQLVL